MSARLPAPLVPAGVDLRDFGFMALDVQRLRDSDLATYATGEEFKAAMLLWCASWHQIPPASLPNDDRWLARHSGAGREWPKVKTGALRGFVKCSDGKLYHPVVAKKAREAWARKEAYRAQTLKGRIAALQKREREARTPDERLHLQTLLRGFTGAVSGPVTDSVTGSMTGSKGKEQGQGTNKKTAAARERRNSSPGSLEAAAAAAATLIFPERLSHAQRDEIRMYLARNANGDAQVLLDELAGIMVAGTKRGKRIADPVAMLVRLVKDLAAGEFLPSHAHQIQVEREFAEVTAELERTNTLIPGSKPERGPRE